MDLVVVSVIMLFTFGIVFGVAYPLANRSRRRRREVLLQTLAPALGASAPEDIPTPWTKAPLRGLALSWRGHRAALFIQEEGRYDVAWVALLGPSLPRIYVRPETGRDRAGKTLRLNREVQTGDAEFDASTYLETDESDATVQRALAPAPMRASLRSLLTGGLPFVRLGPDMVATRIGSTLTPPSPESIEQALQGLAGVATAAPRIDPSELRAPTRMRGDLIAQATTVTFLVSIVAVYLLPIGYVDCWSPVWDSDQNTGALASFTAWLTLPVLCWVWMRGHSRSFRNYLTTVLLALLPLMLLGTELLFVGNALLDHGGVTPHEVVISRRRTSSGRRTHRYLFAPSWEPPGAEVRMQVAASTYRRFHPGDAVVLFTRPGALGWPWIERMELRRASPSIAVTATVLSVTGTAPVPVGATCAFRVSRRPAESGVGRCQTQIACGGARLYGTESTGYFNCVFTEDPPAVQGRDGATSRGDRDPAMEIDTRAGTVAVWDEVRGSRYQVQLRVSRVN
jgi:hypothetical protein